jgi:hypothetical protein
MFSAFFLPFFVCLLKRKYIWVICCPVGHFISFLLVSLGYLQLFQLQV